MAINALYCEDGDEIQVKNGIAWIDALVKKVKGNGADVEFELGRKRHVVFKFWHELRSKDGKPFARPAAMRPTDKPQTNGSGAFATIGDAVRKPEIPPSPAPAAPKKEPVPAAPKKEPPKIPAPGLTIGEVMRREREFQKIFQGELAKTFDLKDQSTLSTYERGDRVPTFLVVEKFCDLFNYDRAALHELRDRAVELRGRRITEGRKKGARSRIENLAKAAATKAPAAAPIAEAEPEREVRSEFEDAVEAADLTFPMPRDRERRRVWMRLVRELYEVSKEEG